MIRILIVVAIVLLCGAEPLITSVGSAADNMQIRGE